MNESEVLLEFYHNRTNKESVEHLRSIISELRQQIGILKSDISELKYEKSKIHNERIKENNSNIHKENRRLRSKLIKSRRNTNKWINKYYNLLSVYNKSLKNE